MGGIISSNLRSLRDYKPDSTISKILPSYFSSKLYLSDLIVCYNHWNLILADSAISYHHCSWKKMYFDSCQSWFESILYRELIYIIKLPHLHSNIQKFVDLNLNMILLHFKALQSESQSQLTESESQSQSKLQLLNHKHKHNHHHHHYPNSHYSQLQIQQLDSELTDICLQLIRLGFQFNHFIAFGSSLFQCLHIVFGDSFTSQCKSSWTNLYSSILIICLPLCLATSSTTLEGQQNSLLTNEGNSNSLMSLKETSNDTTNQLSSEETFPMSSHVRVFATLHNSISL